MELTLGILDYLINRNYSTIHNGNWSPNYPIKKVKLWDGSSNDPHTLYLLADTASDQYQLSIDPSLAILNITCKTITSERGYYLTCPNIDPLIVLNDVLDLYMDYLRWQETILRYDQYAHNLQALLDCTAEYLKTAFVIMNNHYQIMFSDTQGFGLLWDDIIDASGQMTMVSIQQLYIDDPNFDDTFAQKGLISYEVDILETYKIYYYNIFDGENYVGRILIYVSNKENNNSFLSMLSTFCKHVENCYLYLHHREYTTEIYKQLHQYLNQIMTVQSYDSTSVTMLLQSINWNTDHQFEILFFQTKGYVTSTQTMDYFCPQIEHTLQSCIAFFGNDGIYCIHNITLDSKKQFHKRLPYFLRENLFQVGISYKFDDFFKFPYYAREATTALSYGQITHPDQWIHFFKDYALQYCLKQITNEYNSYDLCHPALHALIQYDKTNPGTELVNTLYQYIVCHFNASQAAEELHVHRTTFLYRMKKIHEITELNLDSWNHVLHLMISYSLLNELTGEKKHD